MEKPEGKMFVPAMEIQTKSGPLLIPGQVIRTDNGLKFVPGDIVSTENGEIFQILIHTLVLNAIVAK